MNFVPYGGPVYKPPMQPVRPPSPHEKQENRRLLLLVILFVLACYLLLVGYGEDGYGEGLLAYGHYIASGLSFATWYAIKRFWKVE
jgi:hypothetical protein